MPAIGTDAWFIDTDDNTRIVINDVFGLLRSVQTVSDSDGSCSLESANFLSIVGGLPSDFSANSGSISRFDDRLSLFIEEETPSLFGDDPIIASRTPLKSAITRFDFVNTETMGTSNGNQNQELLVSGSIILLPTLGTPFVFVGTIDDEKWISVADLSTASATDKVFEYDSTLGKVTFGDGVKGAIPEDGKDIILRITIRNGGGQWEKKGIEVDKGVAQVGNIKSARDKIIYASAPIHAIDFRHVVSVTSTINVKEQSITSPDTGGQILSTIREWSFDHGGQVIGTAGSPTTLGVSSSFRSQSSNLIPIPGPIDNHGAKIPAPGDTQHPLLSQLHSSFSVGGSSTVTATALGGVVEPTKFAIILDSDLVNELSVLFAPIFYVREVITFGFRQELVGGGFEFVEDPRYDLYWTIWNAPLFSQSTQHSGWNPTLEEHTGTDDLSDDDVDLGDAKDSIIPNIGTPPNAFPVAGRLIAMADLVGSFVSPVRPLADINTNNFTFLPNSTAIGSGVFHRSVCDSATRHPEWITMTYEFQTTDPVDIAYEKSILGNPISPVITSLFAVEGSVTTLPDVPFGPITEIPHGGILSPIPLVFCP